MIISLSLRSNDPETIFLFQSVIFCSSDKLIPLITPPFVFSPTEIKEKVWSL